MRRHPLLVILACIVAASTVTPRPRARGQSLDSDRAAAVKAGMVVNFARYTTWPETAFADENAPIVITVVGQYPAGYEALAAAARGQTVGDRPIAVRWLRRPAPSRAGAGLTPEELAPSLDVLRAAHVVYYEDSRDGAVDDLVAGLRGYCVLTIGDSAGFAERGGMIALALRDRRIAFDANPDEIRDAGLQMSSQVLKLARIVATRPRTSGGAP